MFNHMNLTGIRGGMTFIKKQTNTNTWFSQRKAVNVILVESTAVVAPVCLPRCGLRHTKRNKGKGFELAIESHLILLLPKQLSKRTCLPFYSILFWGDLSSVWKKTEYCFNYCIYLEVFFL